jgi:hypothetical protein
MRPSKPIFTIIVVLLASVGLACSLLAPSTSVSPTSIPTATPSAVSLEPSAPPKPSPTATLPQPSPTVTSSPDNPDCVTPQAQASLDDLTFGKAPEAILTYLNAGGTPDGLKQALNNAGIANQPVSVQTADMTGNGKNDWVVSIFDPGSQLIPPGGALLIYTCQGGGYELSLNQPTPQGKGGPHLWYLQDLDADGRADLVYSLATCGAHTCFEDVKILSWDSGNFRERLEGSSADLPYPRIEVRDPDGDGIFQLEVTGTGIGSVGAGPQREITWAWTYDPGTGMWDKTSESLGTSNYRIHILQDADTAARQGDYQNALVLYQRVVSDPTLQDWVDPEKEQAELGAYAHFKIMTLYLILGQDDFASTAFQEMKNAYPSNSLGYAYVELADAFRQAYMQGGIAAGCEAANSFAGSHTDQILLPLNSFGYGNPEYTPQDICPFQ